MFNRKPLQASSKSVFSNRPVALIEGLEDRRLMSAGPVGLGHGGTRLGGSVQFSQAPAAVQTGLTTLAATDNVTAPVATTPVRLGNTNGVETYTVTVTSTGTTTQLTVDQNGKPITNPTRSSTTFGALTSTTVTDEIVAIATGLGLTAPTSSTPVDVNTPASGPAVYTVHLSSSTSTTTTTTGKQGGHGVAISVDANGLPVGNQQVPLGTLPTAIQNGLTSHAPTGAAALTSSSLIFVRTLNGVTTYSVTYTISGTSTTVTVDTAGALHGLPITSSLVFSAIPAATQAELQALATADGVSGTISSTQTVTAYDEANGTTVYSVSLVATGTDSGGNSYTYSITLSADQAGNPTIPPGGGFGRGGPGGHGGPGGPGGAGPNCGPGGTPPTGTTGSGTTTTTTGTTTAGATATALPARRGR